MPLCPHTPCEDQGTCVRADGGARCDCPPGYEGQYCERESDACTVTTCANGGSCIETSSGPSCQCPEGFAGDECQDILSPCQVQPCRNGGSCLEDGAGFRCECPNGFQGETCDVPVRVCETAPCVNGGACIEMGDGFVCQCRPGFAGETCEIDVDECASAPCQNGGTCVDKENGFSCECPPGFQGEECETNIDDCASSPCQNGGLCSDEINRYTCQCPPGFAGENCAVNIDECADNPCLHGGRCIDAVGGYSCACDDGFEGSRCEINTDDCAQRPCHNGGTCTDGLSSFTCSCTPGFTGTLCETDINECAESPCKNGGTCIDDVNTYRCECLSGFWGNRCEIDLTGCRNGPCQNGGQCAVFDGGFECECPPGFEGDRCETDIDECASQNAGCAQICVNGTGDYRCRCEAGFILAEDRHSCIACEAGTVSDETATTCTPCPADTYDDGSESCRSCPDGFSAPTASTGCLVDASAGLGHPQDYGYLYWPTNHWLQWGQYLDVQHVHTGFYGMAVDVSSASILHLGQIDAFLSAEDALHDAAGRITQLPSSSVSYAVVEDGVNREADGFFGEGHTVSNRSRLIDMGRFMQRIDIPEITYAGSTELSGSMELAAMTRHFALTHRVASALGDASLTVQVRIAGTALSQFPEVMWREGGRAISIYDETGKGWTFVIAEREGATPQITRGSDGSLLFENAYEASTRNETRTLSVIGIPSNAGGEAQLALWLKPQNTLRLEYAPMNRDGSVTQAFSAAQWDPERGIYVVTMSGLGGPNWADPSTHTRYNRHRLIFHNDANETIAVPFAMDGNGSAAYYITGGSPLLRDANGEPVGAPMQISKNWHDPPDWYHLYGTLELSPGSHALEHTFAHAKWGEAFAVAHAQLSLIGWGQNQQWDESSIGAFGESITYDPDLTLSRSMVDDVRPFLVQADRKWSWTGNVGGASFLVYQGDTPTDRPDHQLSRLKTHYAYTGPNLTDVVYAGITRDQKISARISTQLGRTDDLVRAYYHLHYIFHEDVNYERIAFFQVASDRYADNGFRKYAYGNEQDVLFEDSVPAHQSTGYPSVEMRGIPLPGKAPWVMLYDSNHTSGKLPEHLANVGFVVRDFEASIGDSLIATPHININRTYNGGWSQMAFELGLPFDENNRLIPAGSEVRATVEYLIPPADKSVYYGPSDYLNALPAHHFQSPEMMRLLAAENELEVDTFVGTLIRRHPIELLASPGATAVRFVLSGGLGYTPLTIHGLARPDGWRLERLQDGTWVTVDQAVEGNDFWQAYEAVDSDSFDVVFNVKNRGTHQYRLVQGPEPCVGVLSGDARVCADENECAVHNGGCQQSCTNLEGTFLCSCDAGFTLNADGFSCDDVDECETNLGGCAQNCHNEVGSYRCTCDAGFRLHEDGLRCEDIDECALMELNDCDVDDECSNTNGSYVCGCTAPDCIPEGCTDPDAPNYQAAALLDDGSCFVCSAEQIMSFRRTDCTWDCERDWGACWNSGEDEACSFYFCESRQACDDVTSTTPTFRTERAQVAELGNLSNPPPVRTGATGQDLATFAPGETRSIYFDALDYEGKSTRVFAYVGLPADASAATPVPGIVLIHGGGGTAFSTWVNRWKERGYAAIAIAVEGQTDVPAPQSEIDAGQAVGAWQRHAAAGPSRTGAYHDHTKAVGDQWMYHAVADAILAHRLLSELPEVNADQVGVMGISWGGVITATAMGIDSRFAFAIPVYGNGHKYDIPNYFGTALNGNVTYRELWDPMTWIASSRVPALWLTWLYENNFSLDSQAATYHRSAGKRMVSIVPDLGHGHAPAWNRPESYDFADSIIRDGQPWCVQESVTERNGQAEAIFLSNRPLTDAVLWHTKGQGWTGNFTWDNTTVTQFTEDSRGRWTVQAPVPSDATAWLIQVKAAGSDAANVFGYSDAQLVVSSDYQERISFRLMPETGLISRHPLAQEKSTTRAFLDFQAPSYVEIVDVSFRNESHPGALCSPTPLPWTLESPAPTRHALPIEFHNDVAGLMDGEVATAILNVAWSRLDGMMQQLEIPLSVTVRSAFDVVFSQTSPWSSQTVYDADRVTIRNGAEVQMDVVQSAASLTIEDGILRIEPDQSLTITERMQIDAAGQLDVASGAVVSEASAYVIDGHMLIRGGRFEQNMSGISRDLVGQGLVEVKSGTLSFFGGAPTHVLDIDTDMKISGGMVELGGQVYVGFRAPTRFEIMGSAAQISISRLNVGATIQKGTFRFELDENGVSTVQIPGWMNLQGAKLEIDGSDYAGPPTSLILFDSNNLVAPFAEANVSISGFAENGFSAQVVQDSSDGKDWVELVIGTP